MVALPAAGIAVYGDERDDMKDSTDSPRRDRDPGTVRFLVDGTAGSLARWLRLLGFDAACSGTAADYRLVHRARAEGRVLVTRRRAAAALPWAEAVLLQSDKLDEQLRQIAAGFPPQDPPLTRCSTCNTPLEDVERESVRGHVPPYVFRTARSFSRCPRCLHIYWPGTHYREIKARWDELRRLRGPRR